MALLIREIIRIHDETLEKHRDTRVDDWPLMNNFWQPGVIITLYLYFVLVWGPKWMAKIEPFNLNRILLVYNSIQVLVSFSMFVVLSIYIIPYYSFRCEPVDYSNSFRGLLAVKLGWYCLLMKILDLLDTVFFVLRKKDGQITFLHVYHHAGMVIYVWTGVRFLLGGVSVYPVYLNTMVHTFMYTYYFMSAYKNDLSRNVYLKRQMTHLQILQLGLVSISYITVLVTEDCGYPKWTCMIMLPHSLFTLYLFVDFYYKAYIRKRDPKALVVKDD